MIICTWALGASNLKLIIINSTWDCTTFHNFFLGVRKKINRNPSHAAQKTQQGDADIAVQQCRAGPLSIFIFKSWQFCVGINGSKWPRVSRRSNVGAVCFICLLMYPWLQTTLYLIPYHVLEKTCTIIYIPKLRFYTHTKPSIRGI